MYRNFSSIHLIAATTALLFSSCGSKEEDTSLKDFEVTTDTINSEVRVNFDLVRVNIPKPSELSGKLARAKINYNKNFLLSSGKGGSFSSSSQKAIGMGAFGADLGNAVAYNQQQDALEYHAEIIKLATDLGISSAFDPEFAKHLLSSVSKPDTFQLLLDKSFDKAERNLRSNQRVATAVLMIAGGWIESLYISVECLHANSTSANMKPIYSDFSTHCHAFEYISDLLNAYKSNAGCAKLIQDLEPAKAILISAGNNSEMNTDELPKIREAVTLLRNKVIS